MEVLCSGLCELRDVERIPPRGLEYQDPRIYVAGDTKEVVDSPLGIDGDAIRVASVKERF